MLQLTTVSNVPAANCFYVLLPIVSNVMLPTVSNVTATKCV
jgi:hypothetical protein